MFNKILYIIPQSYQLLILQEFASEPFFYSPFDDQYLSDPPFVEVLNTYNCLLGI